MSKNVVLFENKIDCCGCGACYNICPKSAINMQEDEHGFVYPKIDYDLCISCGLCNDVCAYQNVNEENQVITTYVSCSKNKEQMMKSSSGGIFAAAATAVMADGGVVFGSAFVKEGSNLAVRHIHISDISDLIKLQGSKYVQSDIAKTYEEAKGFLLTGQKVLFTGTPCQIAGLKAYLKKDYENLITMDIVCHGVPNLRFLNDYLKLKMKKYRGELIDFTFRDKDKGWGQYQRIDYINRGGDIKKKHFRGRNSSYHTLFLDSHTYRENCYNCKYSCSNRPGDITMGDYWGIEVEHPELIESGVYSEQKGISCVIVNSVKGDKFILSLTDKLNLDKSDYSKAAKRNSQLRAPSVLSQKRAKVLEAYSSGGYDAVEKYYKKTYGIKILAHKIFGLMSPRLKTKLKSIIKRG